MGLRSQVTIQYKVTLPPSNVDQVPPPRAQVQFQFDMSDLMRNLSHTFTQRNIRGVIHSIERQ